MNKINSRVAIIALIAILLLCGFVIMQAKILNRSIIVNQKIFQQRLDVISSKIGESFRRNSYAAHSLPLWIAQNKSVSIGASLEEIIKRQLETSNIRATFSYGLYVHSADDHQIMERVWGATGAEPLILQEAAASETVTNYVLTTLTCGHEYGEDNRYHLAVIIEDDDFYMLSEGISAIAISMLFVVSIGTTIALLVHIINKQKRISELKDDFINNLTHEFKTPIFTINLANRVLRSAPSVKRSVKLSQYCKIIADETERLKTQVDTILQMSLVDSGNFQLDAKPTDIHQLLHMVARNFDLMIAEKQGKIVMNFKSTLPIISVDPLHLRNAFNNLIDNAIKYNASSYPLITIETSDSVNALEVSIKDNGVGMNEETKKRIFQRFYRAQQTGTSDVKGFGLGLSYVKQIVDAHNGVIQLHSEVNCGSEFMIQFRNTHA